MTAGKRERAPRDDALRRLAARQHGLVHRHQALRAGLSDSGINRRVAAGAWVRHHRSVYGVAGSPATFEQRGLAACMAVGRSAAVAHTTAGRMWGLCDDGPLVEIIVRGSVTARPRGVVVHRTTTLRAGDTGILRGVPVTSPARTLFDLAEVLPEDVVERALQEAVVSGLVEAGELRRRARAESRRGRRGPRVLRRLLPEDLRGSHVTTPLEKLVADLLRAPGLPPFVREHRVVVGQSVFYVDFAVPSLRIGVEADGRRWHTDAPAFERDRRRHNALTQAGWRVLRVTHAQVRSDPEGVRKQIGDLVGRASGKRE